MPGTAQISPRVLTHWLLTVSWRRFYQYHIVTGRERGWELAQGLTFGIYWDLNTDQLSLGPVLTITNDFQLMARKGTVPVVGFKFTSVWLEESPLRSSSADCWMQMAGVWRHCGPWSLTSEQKPPSPVTPMWCVCTEATRYLQASVHLTIICRWQWWRCGHWLASVESVGLHLSLNYFSF